MASNVSRGSGYICRFCRSHTQNQFSQRYKSISNELSRSRPLRFHGTTQTRNASSTKIPPTLNPLRSKTSPSKPRRQTINREVTSQHASDDYSNLTPSIDTSDATGTLRNIRNEINAIALSEKVPEQATVLQILDSSYQFANLLVFGQSTSPEEQAQEAAEDHEEGSVLSDLEESSASAATPSAATSEIKATSSSKLSVPYRERAARELCESIYNLLKDPKVNIDEDILSIYVRIVCQLGEPAYLPEIFFLYANKPVAQPGTSSSTATPIRYSNPNPNAAKNAVPQQLSDVALDTAILQRDLPLAIAIIDTTVATRAFRRNKFLRKGSLPLAAVGSTPLVAWAGAEWVAQWQNTFDPAVSKQMTMMGAMAYIGTLGTIGFIALTTWNDHHDRVVWTPGTPLRYRWSREEERLYFDRIAVAWGFQKRHRRGEEMGEEWEALREILGERSMILDKSDLLEGMQ